MRKISDETQKILDSDPFMQTCCVSGRTPVQRHHNLIYATQQCDAWWSILPLHKDVHDQANEIEMRRKLDHIMLNRAPEAELKKYSKVMNLIARRDWLNSYFRGKGENN